MEDRKYYPVFYFYTFLNIGLADLRALFLEKGDKSEHSDVVVLSREEMQRLLEKTPEQASDLTLTGIDLYLFV